MPSRSRAYVVAFAVALCLPTGPAAAWADDEPALARIQELAEPVRGLGSPCEFQLQTLPVVGFFSLGDDAVAANQLVTSPEAGRWPRSRPHPGMGPGCRTICHALE